MIEEDILDFCSLGVGKCFSKTVLRFCHFDLCLLCRRAGMSRDEQ
jgi:hypothetical protein